MKRLPILCSAALIGMGITGCATYSSYPYGYYAPGYYDYASPYYSYGLGLGYRPYDYYGYYGYPGYSYRYRPRHYRPHYHHDWHGPYPRRRDWGHGGRGYSPGQSAPRSRTPRSGPNFRGGGSGSGRGRRK